MLLLLPACTSKLRPWRNEPIGNEINAAFTIENNLLFLSNVEIDGHPGRYLLGSATIHTVLDPAMAPKSRHSPAESVIAFEQRRTLIVQPVQMPLGHLADGIVGADAWGAHALTIDYHSRMLTYQKEGIHPDLMSLFRFSDAPTVRVRVDGMDLDAIVDTTCPDSLILPRGSHAPGRVNAHVALAGTDFGTIDVRYADTAAPRIGNRILSKFLVTIDYGRHEVGLWRDPRTR